MTKDRKRTFLRPLYTYIVPLINFNTNIKILYSILKFL